MRNQKASGEVDLLAALREVIGRDFPPPRRPRHPETGCPCDLCVARDDRLESIAEERADRYY